jgi:hypothetical protein
LSDNNFNFTIKIFGDCWFANDMASRLPGDSYKNCSLFPERIDPLLQKYSNMGLAPWFGSILVRQQGMNCFQPQ